jgi:hypothetical protein
MEPPRSEVVTPREAAPGPLPGPEVSAVPEVTVPDRAVADTWRARVPRIASPVGAMMVVAAAALIVISTFINWVQGSTGWNLVFRPFGTSGTFFLTWWSKGVLLSGFWSLLVALLVFVGAVMFFTGREGGRLLIVCGTAGVVIALFDIIMVYVNGAYFPAGAGLGLWLLAVFSLVTIALGLSVAPTGD